MALLGLSVLLLACLPYIAIGQFPMADNLIVSGTDLPMAYGVGTYGLQGAGSQGISGESPEGGLFSPKIPTVTISNRIPGVVVSDGSGHSTDYQNMPEALGAMGNILNSGIQEQVKAHSQQGAGQGSAEAAAVPRAAPVWREVAASPTAVEAAGPVSEAQEGGRRLLQGSILQNMGAQALNAVKQTVVGSTSDLSAELARAFQPGDLPTVTTSNDGTVQLLSNNNSGDELQLQRDGTLTYVNGGDSPGIFSVGPTGVHLEKDNVFHSRAYAGSTLNGASAGPAAAPSQSAYGSQGSASSAASAVAAASSAAGSAAGTVAPLAPQAAAAAAWQGPTVPAYAAAGALSPTAGPALGPASSAYAAAAAEQAPTDSSGQGASAYSADYPASSAFTIPVRDSSAGAPASGEAAQAPAAGSGMQAGYGSPAQQSTYVPATEVSAEPAAEAPAVGAVSSEARAYMAQAPAYQAQAPAAKAAAAPSYAASAAASGYGAGAPGLSNSAVEAQQSILTSAGAQGAAAGGNQANLQRILALLGRRRLAE